jgi:hypothetical protein
MNVLLIAILGCIVVLMLMVLIRKTAGNRTNADHNVSTVDTRSSSWSSSNDPIAWGTAAAVSSTATRRIIPTTPARPATASTAPVLPGASPAKARSPVRAAAIAAVIVVVATAAAAVAAAGAAVTEARLVRSC